MAAWTFTTTELRPGSINDFGTMPGPIEYLRGVPSSPKPEACSYCGGTKGWDGGGSCKGCAAPKAARTVKPTDVVKEVMDARASAQQFALEMEQTMLGVQRQKFQEAVRKAGLWESAVGLMGGLFR